MICLLMAVASTAQLTQTDTTAAADSSAYHEEIYIEDYQVRRVYLPFELRVDSVIRDTVPVLRDIHERESWSVDRATTGNSFAPGYSLKFDDPIRIGPRLGFDGYVYRRFELEKDQHFQSSVPLTNLFYSMGSKAEQEFNGIHHHSFSERFDLDFRLHKQNAPGFYSGERTNMSYLSTTTYWTSANLHWQNETYFRYTGMQFGQNGGLYTDTAYDDPDFQNLRLFETPFSTENLQTLRNNSSWNDVHRAQILGSKMRYIMGSTQKKYTADSTQQELQIQPSSYLEFGLERESQKYNMYYQQPDSSLLSTIDFEGLRTLDTLGTNSRLVNYNLNMAYALPLSRGMHQSALKIHGGYTLSQFQDFKLRNNFSLGADLDYASRWGYLSAQSRIYVAGANAGDLSAGGRAVFDWGQLQNRLDYSFVRSSAPYFYQNATFNNIVVSNNLKKETHQHLGWTGRYKLLKVKAGMRSYYNYIALKNEQWGLDQLVNHDALLNIYYLGLGLEHQARAWGTDIDVYLQRVPADFPLSAPELITSSRMYVHDAWFEDRIYFFTGVQLDLTSKYRSSPYDLFYNQFAGSRSTTPFVRNFDLQYFLDFQVSRAKLFLKVSQINQLFMGNYSLGSVRDYSGQQSYHYIGSQNLGLRFGVSWLMIN